jgi:hypothetical protein
MGPFWHYPPVLVCPEKTYQGKHTAFFAAASETKRRSKKLMAPTTGSNRSESGFVAEHVRHLDHV